MKKNLKLIFLQNILEKKLFWKKIQENKIIKYNQAENIMSESEQNENSEEIIIYLNEFPYVIQYKFKFIINKYSKL